MITTSRVHDKTHGKKIDLEKTEYERPVIDKSK
jgi:hypothetical protein